MVLLVLKVLTASVTFFNKALLRVAPPVFLLAILAALMPAQQKKLVQIQHRLMQVTVAQGKFEQTAPDGNLETGRFWIHKPGRIRFIYDKSPSPTLMTDGTWLMMQEPGMLPQRYPLNMVPLSVLLADSSGNALPPHVHCTALVERGSYVYVTFSSEDIPGHLTLIVHKKTFDLVGWNSIDIQGFETKIRLKNITTKVAPPPDSFFTLYDSPMRPFDRGRN